MSDGIEDHRRSRFLFVRALYVAAGGEVSFFGGENNPRRQDREPIW